VPRFSLTVLIFLLVVTAMLAGVHFYLWHRLLRATELGKKWQRAGGVALAVLAALIPTSMFLMRVLPRPTSMVLALVVYTWMGLVALLVSILIITEVVRAAVYAGAALRARPLDPARRTFLSRLIAGSAGVVTVGLAGSGAASALGPVAVANGVLYAPSMSGTFYALDAVQLTDVHIGPTIGGAWLAEIVKRVNALEPDIVVITGDLVDGSVATLRQHVAPLADLRSRHGVYFVTGNHEYYSGAVAWIEELTRLNVRVLRNERVSIGDGDASFDLAGVDDWTAGHVLADHGPDLKKALAGRDPSRELILLAHQPRQIFDAVAHDVGLQISGHTHGGQIFPVTMLVWLQQPYVAGLSKLKDTQIYVSRGTGYWGPPMRVGAPAEITLIELEPETVRIS